MRAVGKFLLVVAVIVGSTAVAKIPDGTAKDWFGVIGLTPANSGDDVVKKLDEVQRDLLQKQSADSANASKYTADLTLVEAARNVLARGTVRAAYRAYLKATPVESRGSIHQQHAHFKTFSKEVPADATQEAAVKAYSQYAKAHPVIPLYDAKGKTLFEVLTLPQTATREELSARFKAIEAMLEVRVARKEKDAEAMLSHFQAAHNVLLDPMLASLYRDAMKTLPADKRGVVLQQVSHFHDFAMLEGAAKNSGAPQTPEAVAARYKGFAEKHPIEKASFPKVTLAADLVELKPAPAEVPVVAPVVAPIAAPVADVHPLPMADEISEPAARRTRSGCLGGAMRLGAKVSVALVAGGLLLAPGHPTNPDRGSSSSSPSDTIPGKKVAVPAAAPVLPAPVVVEPQPQPQNRPADVIKVPLNPFGKKKPSFP